IGAAGRRVAEFAGKAADGPERADWRNCLHLPGVSRVNIDGGGQKQDRGELGEFYRDDFRLVRRREGSIDNGGKFGGPACAAFDDEAVVAIVDVIRLRNEDTVARLAKPVE